MKVIVHLEIDDDTRNQVTTLLDDKVTKRKITRAEVVDKVNELWSAWVKEAEAYDPTKEKSNEPQRPPTETLPDRPGGDRPPRPELPGRDAGAFVPSPEDAPYLGPRDSDNDLKAALRKIAAYLETCESGSDINRGWILGTISITGVTRR